MQDATLRAFLQARKFGPAAQLLKLVVRRAGIV